MIRFQKLSFCFSKIEVAFLQAFFICISLLSFNGILAAVELPPPLQVDFTTVDVTCKGADNGCATLSIIDGVPPYEILWINTGESGLTECGLEAGNHPAMVSDSDGALIFLQIPIEEPNELVAAFNFATNSDWNECNASATLTISGGTAPFTYILNDEPVVNPNFENICPGSYSIQVMDANFCTAAAAVLIEESDPIVSTVNIANASCSGMDGCAEIITSGGVPPFQYIWDNGLIGPSHCGLTVGTYSVEITDSSGASSIVELSIEGTISTLETAITTYPSTFGNCDGQASIDVAGGTPPYTYTLDDSGTIAGNDILDLCPGLITIQITDADGCESQLVLSIEEGGDSSQSIVVEYVTENVQCNGFTNGSATISITEGTPPYDILWIESGGTGITQSGLSPGIHTVQVTDATGQSVFTQIQIDEPQDLLAFFTTGVPSDFGLCNGTAEFEIIGGIPPYHVDLNGETISGDSIQDLCPGTIVIIVTDANGCPTAASILIEEPEEMIATIATTDVSCFGMADGCVTIEASGGTAPFQYIWNNGLTGNFICGLSAGLYTVQVLDSNGIESLVEFWINEPEELQVFMNTTPASNENSCNGTGIVSYIAGLPPITFDWGENDPAALCPGTYEVLATDANGCVAFVSGTVGVANEEEPEELVATAVYTEAVCFGTADACAYVEAAGGTPPYTYLWSTGNTGQEVCGLASGSYNVIVTDSEGQTTNVIIEIYEPIELVVNSSIESNASGPGECDGIAFLDVTGGLWPYTYETLGNGDINGNQLTGLCEGITTIFVTDANGCLTVTEVSIEVDSNESGSPSTVSNIQINPNITISSGPSIGPSNTGKEKPAVSWIEDGGGKRII